MAGPYFDKKEQFDKIRAGLLAGERIDGVFDMKGGGTGFIGITSMRVIVYDKAFARKMKALVSIPYSRIQSVAAEDDSGLLTGRGFFVSSKVVMTTSHGELEFEFRGAEKAHYAYNLILHHMMGIPLAPAQTVICPRCRTESPQTIAFCPSCGQQRAQQAA
jgi:hypothetical protein